MVRTSRSGRHRAALPAASAAITPAAPPGIRLFVLLGVLAALVAATLVVIAAVAAPAVAASEDCVAVAQPVDRFEIDDAAGRWYIEWDVAELTPEQVDLVPRISLAGAEARAFSAESVARMAGYFEAIDEWVAYLDAPCIGAVAYVGPVEAPPTVPPAPYGFGGPDVTPIQPVRMGFIDAVDSADSPDSADSAESAEATPIFNAADDRPALANSGTDAYVLAYFGAGLLAFGATALGLRQRVQHTFIDSDD